MNHFSQKKIGLYFGDDELVEWRNILIFKCSEPFCIKTSVLYSFTAKTVAFTGPPIMELSAESLRERKKPVDFFNTKSQLEQSHLGC